MNPIVTVYRIREIIASSMNCISEEDAGYCIDRSEFVYDGCVRVCTDVTENKSFPRSVYLG